MDLFPSGTLPSLKGKMPCVPPQVSWSWTDSSGIDSPFARHIKNTVCTLSSYVCTCRVWGLNFHSNMFHLVRLHTCFLSLGMFVIIIHTVASSLRTNDLWARHPAKSGIIHKRLQPQLHPSKGRPLWLPFDKWDIWSLAEPGCKPRPLISPIKLCFIYMGKSPPLASPLAFVCLDSYWL